MSDEVRRIGLISDTHGLVRPEVHDVLDGVELILHAGDVGGDDVLDELSSIAPVEAVYGNCDSPDDPRLAESLVRVFSGVTVHVSHGHEVGSPNPARLRARYSERVLVYGHTHRPLVELGEGQLVVNPGAAGQRRFNLLPSVAILTVQGGEPTVEIISLPDR